MPFILKKVVPYCVSESVNPPVALGSQMTLNCWDKGRRGKQQEVQCFPNCLKFSSTVPALKAEHLDSFNLVLSFSFAQMELDRSADPPPAIWVSTTKSSVNKWVSMRDTSEITGRPSAQYLWNTMFTEPNAI